VAEIEKVLSITLIELLAGKRYSVGEFVLTKDGLYFNTKKKDSEEVVTIKICEPLFVESTVQNIDSKEVQINLNYKFKDHFHKIDVGMGQMIPSELLKLASKGVDVPFEYVKLMSTYLREQQKLAPHVEIYKNVGWHVTDDGEYVFRAHQTYSKNGILQQTNNSEDKCYNLEPKGDLSAWLKVVEDEVLGNIPMEFLVSVGFSSIVVGYLSKRYSDVDSLLVHLVGNSTQGKTTGGNMGVSAHGYPSTRDKGLVKTWNGTNNAILNNLSGNYGITVVLDELSMNETKSLNSFIYSITSGQDKARLSEEIKQRKQGTWATTIISTGEQSIFERTSKNIGLTVRAFECSNLAYTTSAENADNIKAVIQDNYGHAGIEVVKYLFKQGLEIIENTWEKWQETCIEKLPNSQFRTRIARKYAIILTAGELANQALGLKLNLDAILEFLVKEELENSQRRDIGDIAYSQIIQSIVKHQANFKRDQYYTPSICWGKMIKRSNHIEVAFLKHVLEDELRNIGFQEPKVVLRSWKDSGYLITEGDRQTKRTEVFSKEETEIRKAALEGRKIPKKVQDTTYNLIIPTDAIKELLDASLVPDNASKPKIQNSFNLKSEEDEA
jgi:uncharacterized protein (DUF927 family)